jgi:ubiquitin carboxyl-terminal hydrolase 10
MIHPYNGDLNDKSGLAGAGIGKFESGSSVSLGRREAEMAAFLKSYALNHKAQSLKPRGLSNRSNWCFVNAIMQALIACPPFYNLVSLLI